MAFARGLGLGVVDPHVLGVGANVVVHLAPLPIVARVATLTAEMRGASRRYLALERDIAAALADRGLDVIRPTRDVDPGPHLIAGRWVLLTEYRQLTPFDVTSTDHATLVGRSFPVLSDALAELRPATLEAIAPGYPWQEIAALLHAVEPSVAPDVFARIHDAVEELRAGEPQEPLRLVHGDAHRVNVESCGDRVVWFDFEDANLRPLTWDLATLRRAWPAAGETACAILGVDPSSDSMRWNNELREVYALAWNLLHAQRFERAKKPTEARLMRWLAAR